MVPPSAMNWMCRDFSLQRVSPSGPEMLLRTGVTLASRSHTPRRFVYRHTDRSPHSPSSLFLLPAWTVPRGSDRPRNLVPSPSLGARGRLPSNILLGGKRRLVEGLRGYRVQSVTLGIQNVPGLHYQIRGEGSIYVHRATPTRPLAHSRAGLESTKQRCNHSGRRQLR
jgi:hypothetical protein